MESNKPTPAAEEMSRTPFIAEERQTVAGKFAIKNIENGMLQVLYSLADLDEIILIDHKVEILESVKFGKNSEVLSIRTNTGENGAPPSFYLLFLKKKQRWILRPLDLGKLCKIRNFSQSPFGGFIFEESDGNFPSGRN